MRLPYEIDNRVRITSAFGNRTDPISGATGTFHSGLDLVGLDNKHIVAPIGGVVLVSQIVTDKTNRTWEWGNYICISGDDGNLYYLCHMSRRSVSAGKRVEEGELIGIEGSTGYSTGSHCHLEIRDANNKQIDPSKLLGIENKAGTVWVVNGVDTPNVSPNELDNIPADWSREAVEWAVETGILKGDEHGDLMLRSNVTREQMIVFLHRFFKKYI